MEERVASAGEAAPSRDSLHAPSSMQRSASHTRNQPVKRYDGEPLTRMDVQHAILCYLLSDTRRVFTNPRPGPRGTPMSTIVQMRSAVSGVGGGSGAGDEEDADGTAPPLAPAVQATVAAAVTGPFPAFVWPYGQSVGSARRSDETPEEFEAWQQRRAEYTAWRDAHFPASITPVGELDEEDAAATRAWEHPGAEKLTFKELYLEALLNSSKCTKSMREKCLQDEEYAEDFSKVCLLVNVGRINTTLAFYPEMKTILRSYHPVPSLQKSDNTRRNMQDAPRMKSLLKAVLLPYERPAPPGVTTTVSASARHTAAKDSEEVPTDLGEVVRRLQRGRRPPTSIVTLIFLLTQQAGDVGALHFAPPLDMHSLFFPHAGRPLSARQRADVFLWLMYHYMEGPAALPPGAPGTENPFDDAFSSAARARAHDAWVAQGSEPLSTMQPEWRGVPNPAYAQWRSEHDAAAPDAGSETRRAARRTARESHDDADEGDAPPCPEPFCDRVLAPALDRISWDKFLAEDADTPEEIAWGKQMQEERAAFLVRFQEEEQAKVLAQNGYLEPPAETEARRKHASPAVDEGKAKKRIHPGTQSCYPLANILANAAAAGSHGSSVARSPIGFVKRARLSSRQAQQVRDPGSSPALTDGHYEHGAVAHDAFSDHAGDDRTTLWDLDLRAEDGAAPSLLAETWAGLRRADASRTAGPADDNSDDDESAHMSVGTAARILLIHRKLQSLRQAAAAAP
ncbi:RNA helicase [Malassezia sp. CBS 17886]|nr:RNA helicase [Malassezia sp. CBS 17886]